ncbi:MAG TPA: hypothetical protein VKV74_08935, partial [Bryobacteraceae bacterium]|nr:hypothetical protein [Bryobacteraceae bacterium]
GAVVLAPGEYDVAGTLTIARSGVVLRGEKGAGVRLTGKPHCFLEIRGSGEWSQEGSPAPILDAYVPSGSASFRVRGASDFHPGDHVLVLRPVTPEWMRFVGIDPPRDNQGRTAAAAGGAIRTDRVIESVDRDRVTLDVPLSDALDSQFTAASLVRYRFPGRIREVGVEQLRIAAPMQAASPGLPYTAVRLDAVEDGWVRDLEIQDAQNGIVTGPASKRLTLTNVRIAHAARQPEGAQGADFALQGTQILVDRSAVTGDGVWPVVTQGEAVGPLVVLNFTADQAGVAPRQGWATGLLVDGAKFPGATERRPGVVFSACADAKFGFGCIGWSVAWNVVSPFLFVQQPPGALNWCIGCVGRPLTSGGTPSAILDSPGKMVAPSSLYLQQLRDRLGPEALRNIGYGEGMARLL